MNHFNKAFNLSKSYKLIKVCGSDTEKLINSISTNNIRECNRKATYNTFVNNKSKLIADFFLFKNNDGSFYAIVHNSKHEAFCTSIQQYSIFYDNIQTIDIPCIIIYANKSNKIIAKSFLEIKDYRKDNMGSFHAIELTSLHEKEVSHEKFGNYSDYCDYLIDELIIPPHQLQHKTIIKYCLQDLNAVSYSKGCYPGQEVLMRNKTSKNSVKCAIATIDLNDKKYKIDKLSDQVYLKNILIGTICAKSSDNCKALLFCTT